MAKTLTLFNLKTILKKIKTSNEFSEIKDINNWPCNFSVMYLTHIVSKFIHLNTLEE